MIPNELEKEEGENNCKIFRKYYRYLNDIAIYTHFQIIYNIILKFLVKYSF